MSYSDVFGGATIYPAGQTYLSLIFSTDQELAWPIEQAIAGQNVVSSIMDLAATAPGLNVDLPDARQVSQGIQSVFNNVGGNTITIRDATGGPILSIINGTAWVAYLTDNTTEAGSWRIFQLGAGMTVAVASALAGAGIKAILTTLNQTIAPTSTAVTPITWTDGDRAQLTVWTGGLGILNFPNPGVVGSDWFSMIRNGGTGDLTLTPPSGVIDDLATLQLGPGESATIVTDGTNFFTVGLGQSTAGFFDFVEINVAGSGDFTLSGVQLNRISYRFTGALTGNRNIVVPNTVQQYWVDNSTTGAFSFFVNTVAQITPVQILQGDRTITYCDGTDVVPAESATVSFPISIGQGGTGANNAVTALSNLGGAPLTRLLNTSALSGLGGGGDLTADRDFVLDVDNLTVELAVDPVADTLAFYDDDVVAMRKAPIASFFSSDSLIDSGGNVRAFADIGGNLQLRSVGNSDSEPRRLQFTWQDGTVVGFIGQNSFSQEMLFQNNINHPDGTIEISTTHVSAEIIVGGLRTFSAGLQVRGGNTAAINLTDASWVNRARIGYTSSDVLRFENMPQQTIVFEGEDSITATVSMLEMNPNTGCHLFFKGDGEIARSALLANGGFEVNNTVTGGGFERALTASDLAPVAQTKIKTADESVTNSTTLQNDNQLQGYNLLANKTYRVEVFLNYLQNVGNFKWQFSLTAAINARAYQYNAVDEAGVVFNDFDDGLGGGQITTLTDNVSACFSTIGFLRTGVTPPTLTFQWAQQVLSGNATTVFESSYMIVTQLD